MPLEPDVSRNNCNESATLRPIPDNVGGGPGLEEGRFALIVNVRARRRLIGSDDERDGDMEELWRERREEKEEAEESDETDMGDVERGRGECESFPKDSCEGDPGEEIVDRGMPRGNVIARTTTGEPELVFLASKTLWDCDDLGLRRC